MMKEQPSKHESDKLPHRSTELAQALIKGGMSKEDFLREIDALDQATVTHADSIKNVEVLENPEIRRIFERDPDFENTRSVAHFHVAQIRAMQNRIEEALQALAKSYEAARNVQDPNYQDWTRYVEATAMYLRKDIAALDRVVKSGSVMNQKVIESLHKGLKETGVVDYRRDYGE